jgi:fatty acid CoA ligase FadD9
MVDAGCRIERLPDHREWFLRFETALRNLPTGQRQASLLPIVATFRHELPAADGAAVDCRRFQSAVAHAQIGAIPHITAATIAKYVSDLELLGLIDRQHREMEN